MSDNLTVVAGVPTVTFIVPTDGVNFNGGTNTQVPLCRVGKVSGTGGAKTIGSLNFHLVALASTNTNLIKNAAGLVYSVDVFNNTNYPVFVKLYNKGSGVPA